MNEINGRIVAEALAKACDVKLAEESLLMYSALGKQADNPSFKDVLILEENEKQEGTKSIWIAAESNILLEGVIIPKKDEPPMRIVTYKCKTGNTVKVFDRLVVDPEICNKIADAINCIMKDHKTNKKEEKTPTMAECLKFLFGKD